MINKSMIIRNIKESLEKREEIIFAYLHDSFTKDLSYKDIYVAIFVDEKAISHDDVTHYGLKLTAIIQRLRQAYHLLI